MKVFADELNRLIAERGWRNADLAREFPAAAKDAGLEPCKPPPETTISRWRSGERRPGAYYAQVLCNLFERSPSEFGLVDDIPFHAPALDVSTTLDLARRLTISEMDPASLDALEDAVNRLARAYSTTHPAKLLPQVQIRLQQTDDLLRRRITLPQHSRLLAAAGWLQLTLAALHFDLGQREAAHVSRDAALQLGREAHDPNITGWAFETPAWFSLTEGRPLDALDFAEQGRQASSPGSSAHIMCVMKIAIAQARIGDRRQAESALDEAQTVVAAMPVPEYPDHHFVFDPPKFSQYASEAYRWLGQADLVVQHAREVVRQSSNPRWRSWVPSRVQNVRMDLAQVLLAQRRLDEAAAEAMLVFDSDVMRHDTIVRAAHLDAQFAAAYPTTQETSDLHERLLDARRRFYNESDPGTT